ncbi:MAG: HAMP domain-containing protein [Oscillospiraceae bacterium]|nr:HAMP domain-containing protein [Oscillospiraceae bacterium]
MKSLRTKLVTILVLLIVAVMTAVGSFLINGVSNFYVSQFYDQMFDTFNEDLLLRLSSTASEPEAPERLKELLMAQPNLGIDLSGRNVYVLSQAGTVLSGSGSAESVRITDNILAAMNGEVGQDSSVVARYMDLAVPVSGENENYIIYVLDTKATVNALNADMLSIILRALALGLVICVILAFVLAQILITPIRALTVGTQQVASFDFSQKLEVTGRDEIGTLTRNFNHMSRVLQNTLSEMENERNKLSTLFLHMTDGVAAFSPDGLLIHYNPAAVQMLGRNLDPSVNFNELFGEVADLKEVLALRRPNSIGAEMQSRDADLELQMAPFSGESATGGVLVVIHDVTEQHKAAETQREFVANVSHELRTPLTNVKSYAETLQDSGDELPEELKQNFLGVIVSETDRMTRIVQDLLTLSRLDFGKMEMNLARFSFAQAVQDVYEATKMEAERHGHTMEVEISPDTGDVYGDQGRIEQVIINIVSNAIKYTPDGGRIELTAGNLETDVFVRVQDNGIGIPEKDLPRLFERFYRVDKARSRESGGTGLGLSIAKQILEQQKGRIEIESEYGKGTLVTITLPRVQ